MNDWKMASTGKSAGSAASGSGAQDVDALLGPLDHPLKDGVALLRATVLAASPAISEGVKWNSPSFRTTEWFGTINIRKDSLMLILHLGAKARAVGVGAPQVADPAGLLKWLGKDRAALGFADLAAIQGSRDAIARIVRQWIEFLD